MGKYLLYNVNAFTKDLNAGNTAGVILDAEGLSIEKMQEIARDSGHTTTAFIFPPESEDHDIRIKFFTPTNEIPMCGHATVAANYVLARTMGTIGFVLQKTAKGIIPIEIKKAAEDYKIVMISAPPEYVGEVKDSIENELLSALKISTEDRYKACPIEVISTGNPTALIGIKSQERLNSLKPDIEKLVRIAKVIHCTSYYVFTLDPSDSAFLVFGRVFAPTIGIDEDPATGTANGPLGNYLVRHKLVELKGQTLEYKARQGGLARSGIVEISVKIENDEPGEVQVGGNAVIVSQTVIET